MTPLPAQQPWVTELSIMMQSVLFAAVRAPDGLRKDHPVKAIMRWYRRSVLISAFDGEALNDPFCEGGGSFTGPFTAYHFWHFIAPHRPWLDVSRQWSDWGHLPGEGEARRWRAMDEMRNVYLRHVDEMPHHFQLHLMHAAQIVGEFHPRGDVRLWWNTFYRMIVNDAHLMPEPREALIDRLSDDEDAWRKRETEISND